MDKLDLRVRRKKYYQDHGQEVSHRFYSIVGECGSQEQHLGKKPLHVIRYSPGIKVHVDDLTRERPRWNWMSPWVDLEKWLNEVSSEAIGEYEIAKRFLDGKLKLRSKFWQRENSREIHFLTNKPERYVVTVEMGNEDSIRLYNDDKEYLITI